MTVFEEVRKRKTKAFLLLVGDGKLKMMIQDELRSKGLAEYSLILSNRTDIPDLMNAMDVFVFPSIYEGLPVVLIEAQKMKLPCVISDTISNYVNISNLVRVKSLHASEVEWADSILEPFPVDTEYDHLEEWDMRNVVAHLMKLYQGEE